MDIIGAFISGIMWCLKSLLKGMKWCAQRLWKILRPSARTFGRARWASNWKLWRAGLFTNKGLIIGKRRILFWNRFIRYSEEGHATVIAPPRQGKGAYFIIPNLLDHPGSVIVTDPKGENYAITGKHREKFGPVFKINAIDPEDTDQFNPLDTIRLNSPHTVDDAELIADLMVTPDVKADSHWDEKARMRLTGFILYVITARPPELRTLMEVRRVIMQDAPALEDTLQEMTLMPYEACRDTAYDLRRIMTTGEGPSVLSSMEKASKLWSEDRPVADFVRASDFTMEDFKNRSASLYIMIDADKMAIYAPLLRMLSGLALAAMTRNKTKPEHPVLLMLDECRKLGRIEALPEAIALLSGYGVRVIPIWQDVNQVTELYGNDSMISQCSVQIYFGVNKPRLAEELSKRIGQYTVRSRSAGQSGDMTDLIQAGRSHGESEAGRPLIYPAEIMESRDLFAILPKFPAIKCNPVPYWKERIWKGLWGKW